MQLKAIIPFQLPLQLVAPELNPVLLHHLPNNKNIRVI
jgi:hypothetical protein